MTLLLCPTVLLQSAARTIMKSYGLDAYYNYVQLSAPEFFGMLVNRLGSPDASPNFVYPSFAPSFLDKFPHHSTCVVAVLVHVPAVHSPSAHHHHHDSLGRPNGVGWTLELDELYQAHGLLCWHVC